MLEKDTLKEFLAAVERLDAGFANLPAFEQAIPGRERIAEVLSQAAARLHDNYPYFHPLYAGQMLKPPHPMARLAYALAMWINPNNHALDGGRASSAHGERGRRRIGGNVRLEESSRASLQRRHSRKS